MALGWRGRTHARPRFLGAPVALAVSRTPRETPPSASADLPLPTPEAQRRPNAPASHCTAGSWSSRSSPVGGGGGPG
eukprot:11189747-Lingulodinium_polyedra.AAC.1